MIRSSFLCKLGLIVCLSSGHYSGLVIAKKSEKSTTKNYSLSKSLKLGFLSYLALFGGANASNIRDININSIKVEGYHNPRLIIRPKKVSPNYYLRASRDAVITSDGVEDFVSQKLSDWAHSHSSNIRGHLVRHMAGSFELVEISGSEDKKTIDNLVNDLDKDPEIDTVIVDFPAKAYADPLTSKQWFLDTDPGIGAKALWHEGLEGEGVTVAVIDTGLVDHEDIDEDRILGGYDFIKGSFTAADGGGRDGDFTDPGDGHDAGECPNDPDASENSWHGTHVAGTILGAKDNGKGGSGVAPKANLIAIRALGKCGGSFADILDAMEWSIGESIPGVPDNEHPADIINLSLGGNGVCSKNTEKILAEVKKHAIIVAAAGNDGLDLDVSPGCPASSSHVFTVAATGPKGKLAYYTNTGSAVDAAAAGGDLSYGKKGGILAPVGDAYNAYEEYQGSSMATAVVSGAFALLKNFRNETGISTDEYMAQMANATRPIDGCKNCGFGLIDLDLLSENFTYSAAPSLTAKTYLLVSAGIASGLALWLM